MTLTWFLFGSTRRGQRGPGAERAPARWLQPAKQNVWNLALLQIVNEIELLLLLLLLFHLLSIHSTLLDPLPSCVLSSQSVWRLVLPMVLRSTRLESLSDGGHHMRYGSALEETCWDMFWQSVLTCSKLLSTSSNGVSSFAVTGVGLGLQDWMLHVSGIKEGRQGGMQSTCKLVSL